MSEFVLQNNYNQKYNNRYISIPFVDLMMVALEEAEKAVEHGDVPIGALVFRNGEIISLAHNRREIDHDPTAHAEILALREAASKLKTWHLVDCVMVVTLEPCLMCAGALSLARIDTLIYGAFDHKLGACGTLYNVTCDPRINHRINVISGIMAEQCSQTISDFFADIRSTS